MRKADLHYLSEEETRFFDVYWVFEGTEFEEFLYDDGEWLEYGGDPFRTFQALKQLFGEPHNRFLDNADSSFQDHIQDTPYSEAIAEWIYFFILNRQDSLFAIVVLGDDEKVIFDVIPSLGFLEMREARDETLKKWSRIVEEFKGFLDKQLPSQQAKVRDAQKEARLLSMPNIYRLYFEGAHQLYELLSSLEDSEKIGSLLRAQFFLLIASFEGFLNLMYELYLDPTIRNDKDLYRQIRREPLPYKVRMAPTRCACFQEQKSLRIRKDYFGPFLYLYDVRNDFIHANLLPHMKSRRVMEGRFEFWAKAKTPMKYDFPRDVTQLRSEHVEFVYEIIEKMVDYLLSEMKPRYRREFSEALERTEILVELEGDEYMIVN